MHSASKHVATSLTALRCTLLLFITACGSPDSAINARIVPPLAGTILVNDKAAKPGDPLQVGDTVIAKGDDASVSIKFEDGTVVNLYGLGAAGGDAKLVVVSYDTSTKAMVTRLLSGVVSLISPPKDPPPRKTIEALNTVTATIGTEVKVETSPDGDTVSLKRGKVNVSTTDGSGSVELNSGQMIQVKPGEAVGTPTTYQADDASEKKFFVGPGEDTNKNY